MLRAPIAFADGASLDWSLFCGSDGHDSHRLSVASKETTPDKDWQDIVELEGSAFAKAAEDPDVTRFSNMWLEILKAADFAEQLDLRPAAIAAVVAHLRTARPSALMLPLSTPSSSFRMRL